MKFIKEKKYVKHISKYAYVLEIFEMSSGFFSVASGSITVPSFAAIGSAPVRFIAPFFSLFFIYYVKWFC